jgi:subtilisin family serine protease
MMIAKSCCLGMILSLCFAGAVLPAAAEAGKLRGELPRVLEEAGSDELVPVSIVFADQLTGDRLRARATGVDAPAARRQVLIRALEEHAAASQARVLGILADAALVGHARDIQPLWIGNVVGAELTRAEIERVAALPEVSHVNWNPPRSVLLGPPATPSPPRLSLVEQLAPASLFDDAEIECGVELMRAPEVWDELGVTGEGAVVAVIDTGVCWTHSDIVQQIWVNPGEDLDGDGVVFDSDDENGVDDDGNGFVDDLIGWNFDHGNNTPEDTNSHGSHCAGTVAGDGTAGFQAGMAPDAKIMVVRVGVTFADEVDVWNGMQYAAENGADSISMSLGWPHNQDPDRATWRTNCENTIDLGTAMVIAAGNEGDGNEPDNVRTPGDVPRVITVGAVDCSDNVASFSSRGPVTWQDVPPWNDHPYPPGLIKPDVAAPGVSTRSHNICDGYSNKSGTSMATPHVAGAVALMVAQNPALEHDDLKLLLEDTAVDLGEPGKDNVYGTGRVDAYEAVLSAATPDGRISIREKAVNCDGVLNIVVSDLDLAGNGTQDVEVSSTTEPTPEIVTLTETGADSGVFRGEVSVATGEPTSDGIVQVAHGDVVTALYIDADDGQGGINVEKTDTADIDCQQPVITNVRDTDVGLAAATIRWDTNEPSDSLVVYGPETPPADEEYEGTLVTAHDVRLSRLEECTIYYYEVRSVDPQGNEARDDNGGEYHYFETLGDFGSGPVSCHAGNVTIDESAYSCTDTVTFQLSDLDLNVDSAAIDTGQVLVTSSTEATAEVVTVTETDVNSSTFTGSIDTAAGTPTPDGLLQIADADLITVTYLDADDGTGRSRTDYDTAVSDCVGPAISDLEVDTITDVRATIRWKTGEPADSVVEWGFTPDLGQVITDAGLKTSHAITLNRGETCGPVYFRVASTDEYGYESTVDADGEPFAFSNALIPGLYWKESFENGANGWQLGGEWEVGAPGGLGGSQGRPDPTNPYNNDGVLGHDLTGAGAWPGDYEPQTNEKASSPTLDASSWTNTELIFYRRLQSGSGDDARLWVWTDRGWPIWRSDDNRIDDRQYELVRYDVAGLVDGAPSVRFEFSELAGLDSHYSGWTVDDFILKDATQPDYAACADCSGVPGFAGARSAVDNDACGAAGVTVSWDAAAAWGSGSGGTYAVYRGDAPGFEPGPGTLVAAGVEGLSYNDTSAPAGATSHYLVLAESDESCGTGPANGGVLDANRHYVAVTDTTEVPDPGTVEGLTVTLVADTHVRLEWEPATDATVYKVYRSETPHPEDFLLLAETDELVYDDVGSGTTKTRYFYTVRAANACGVEGD